MSLLKFGIILAITGVVLTALAFGLAGILVLLGLLADSPYLIAKVEETAAVLWFTMLYGGPSVAILGVIIAIVGWWRRRKQKGPTP
jgi:hypothetical protein